MSYQNSRISETADTLLARMSTLDTKSDILKAAELKTLYAELGSLPSDQKASFGRELNELKQSLMQAVNAAQEEASALPPLDVTAPFGASTTATSKPALLPTVQGTSHPLMVERDYMLDIFYRMGFTASESREIDDDYHMFAALNFPEGHPARDDYDTFMTEQTDATGKRLIAPAHTSTMQNRMLRQYAPQLSAGKPIAVVVPDRVFRNEDVDARHEHTFYQIEGVYVDKNVTVGNLIATLTEWLKSYYDKDVTIKTQPFYFPFTEPSFEFAASCIFCNGKGCHICSQTGWIELGGCGMIHPNVLRAADIDPATYSGFAWGFGLERIVMLKYGIEDVRLFKSAKLDFLRQFA